MNNKARDNNQIVLFSCFPPQESGIASYSEDLIFANENFVGCTDDHTLNLWKNKNNKNSKIISYNDFKLLRPAFNIFVIGNSSHNYFALDKALKEGRDNDWLLLHETNLEGLWYFFCKKEGFDFSSFKRYFFGQTEILGILPFLKLSRIRNFFVNNSTAENNLKKELRGSGFKCNIERVFLPLPEIDKRLINPYIIKKQDETEIIIGTFGFPSNEYKSTDKIIELVNYLNDSLNLSSRLVLAGYGVSNYKIPDGANRYILSFDNPDKPIFLSLMSSIDIAIQLRTSSHGESSGCVNELLSLGKPCIVSDGLVTEELKSFVVSVDKEIDVKDLAQIVLSCLKKRRVMELTQFSEFTSSKLSELIILKLHNSSYKC